MHVNFHISRILLTRSTVFISFNLSISCCSQQSREGEWELQYANSTMTICLSSTSLREAWKIWSKILGIASLVFSLCMFNSLCLHTRKSELPQFLDIKLGVFINYLLILSIHKSHSFQKGKGFSHIRVHFFYFSSARETIPCDFTLTTG